MEGKSSNTPTDPGSSSTPKPSAAPEASQVLLSVEQAKHIRTRPAEGSKVPFQLPKGALTFDELPAGDDFPKEIGDLNSRCTIPASVTDDYLVSPQEIVCLALNKTNANMPGMCQDQSFLPSFAYRVHRRYAPFLWTAGQGYLQSTSAVLQH